MIRPTMQRSYLAVGADVWETRDYLFDTLRLLRQAQQPKLRGLAQGTSSGYQLEMTIVFALERWLAMQARILYIFKTCSISRFATVNRFLTVDSFKLSVFTIAHGYKP